MGPASMPTSTATSRSVRLAALAGLAAFAMLASLGARAASAEGTTRYQLNTYQVGRALPGRIVVDGIAWICTSRACRAEGPAAAPTTAGCIKIVRALRAPLAAYRVGVTSLSEVQLAACNQAYDAFSPIRNADGSLRTESLRLRAQ